MSDVVTAALCIIPPQECHGAINDVRRYADKAFPRWMPHINLLYPFMDEKEALKTDYFSELGRRLQHIEPFTVNLSQLNSFPQGRGGGTIHLAPTVNNQQPLTEVFAEAARSSPRHRSQATGKFSPHLTLAQYPLPPKDDHGPFGSVSSLAELKTALNGVKPSCSFTCSEICYITRSSTDNTVPFVVRRRIPLGQAAAQAAAAASCGGRRVPRPLVKKERGQRVDLQSTVYPLALEMAVKWMNRKGFDRNAPKTLEAFTKAIQPFCLVKVQLDTEEVYRMLTQKGWARPCNIKKKIVMEAPQGIPARGRGGARGGRGRGGAAAVRQTKAVETFKVEEGVQVTRSTLSRPGPQRLMFDDAQGLQQRVAYFLYKLQSCVKSRIKKASFISQLKTVVTASAEVPPEYVVSQLVAKNRIQLVEKDSVTYVNYVA